MIIKKFIAKSSPMNPPGIVRRAVGLARTLQNKTAVIASLFSPSREILSLRLHPWQELLSEDDRMEALEQAMVSVTSQVLFSSNYTENGTFFNLHEEGFLGFPGFVFPGFPPLM